MQSFHLLLVARLVDCVVRFQAVLDAMTTYYEMHHANVHRGTYLIAEEATAALEGIPGVHRIEPAGSYKKDPARFT